MQILISPMLSPMEMLVVSHSWKICDEDQAQSCLIYLRLQNGDDCTATWYLKLTPRE